jgi:hypothetical protein
MKNMLGQVAEPYHLMSKTKWVAIKILGLLELGCIAEIYHSLYLIKSISSQLFSVNLSNTCAQLARRIEAISKSARMKWQLFKFLN